jgi:hypothetical protein
LGKIKFFRVALDDLPSSGSIVDIESISSQFTEGAIPEARIDFDYVASNSKLPRPNSISWRL